MTIVAASDGQGGTDTALFYGGIFKIAQSKGSKPTTILAHREADVSEGRQRDRGGQEEEAAAVGRRQRQFRTKGKHSAATVVGTKWLVEDRCKSTLTRVVRGRVSVRDFAKKKTVIVRPASGTSLVRVDTGGPTETIPPLRVRSGSGLIAALLSVLAVLLVPAAASAVVPVTIQSDEQDGECAADCSLRDAVLIASSTGDVVQVPAGTYTLSLGELNVANVTIQGAGAGATVIQAGVNVRALLITGNATIGGVTITGGNPTAPTLAAASRSASARR